MEKEIWREVLGSEGKYLVSNLGNIFSRIVQRNLAICTESNGYQRVSMKICTKAKKHLVHRLVVEAFCGEIDKKLVVDHIDSIRNNNHLSNLRTIDRNHNIRRSKGVDTKGFSLMKINKNTPRMWRADIWIFGKKYFLGSFKTQDEAQNCYTSTYLEFFGNYSS